MSDLFKDIMSENDRTVDICGMVKLLATMSDEDRADVQRALDNPTVTVAAIDRALRKHGYVTNPTTMRRHRRGDCCCGPNR